MGDSSAILQRFIKALAQLESACRQASSIQRQYDRDDRIRGLQLTADSKRIRAEWEKKIWKAWEKMWGASTTAEELAPEVLKIILPPTGETPEQYMMRVLKAIDDAVEGDTDSLVEGDTDSLVEGDTDSLVEGDTDSLVEGNTDSLVQLRAIRERLMLQLRLRQSKGEGSGEADDCTNWITVSGAEKLSGVNKGVISRAADAEEIKTNGKVGRKRRLHAGSFAQWHLQRSPTADPAIAPAEVERRAREERRKRGVVDDD